MQEPEKNNGNKPHHEQLAETWKLEQLRAARKKLVRRIVIWFSVFAGTGLVIWGLIVLAGQDAKIQAGANTPMSLPVLAAVSPDDFSRGSADAKVTIIEYSDFQCPACAYYYTMVDQLAKDFGNQIRIVYRNFPLQQHPLANLAADAAGAAANQGKFWQMYDLLFKNQSSWTNQNAAQARQTFEGYAQSLGLNMTAFKTDMDSAAVKAKVDKDQQSGVQAQIDSTPTFFLNGEYFAAPQDYASFKSAIGQALQG